MFQSSKATDASADFNGQSTSGRTRSEARFTHFRLSLIVRHGNIYIFTSHTATDGSSVKEVRTCAQASSLACRGSTELQHRHCWQILWIPCTNQYQSRRRDKTRGKSVRSEGHKRPQHPSHIGTPLPSFTRNPPTGGLYLNCNSILFIFSPRLPIKADTFMHTLLAPREGPCETNYPRVGFCILGMAGLCDLRPEILGYMKSVWVHCIVIITLEASMGSNQPDLYGSTVLCN